MRARAGLRSWGNVLVAAVAVVAMAPTIADVFLFDDPVVVRDNALLAAGHVAAFFRGNLFGDAHGDLLFRPLWLLSLFVDRALFGNNALAFHVVSVALHALAAVLLFRVALHLVDDARRALAVALLFAVHPVHLDAVAFITNRSEVLALVFLLAGALALLRDPAWRAFVRDEPPPSAAPSPRTPIALAALALLAALFCKETAGGALALLFVLVAVRASERRRLAPSVLAGVAAFVAAFAVYVLARRVALGALTVRAATAWIDDRRAVVLLPTVSRIFARYLRLAVVPYPLHFDYSSFVVSRSPLEPVALASYALHAVVLGGALALVRRRANLALCILGFYAALAPVSHLLPFREILAERFLYIPSVFACALVAFVPPRRAVWMLVALYGLVCVAEATHFHSAEALWTTVVERDPANPRAQYNLGTTYFESGRCADAVPHLEAAIALDRAYARAWANLGQCRAALGDDAGAGAALETAARLDEGNARAHRNLAVYRALHGDGEGARRELDRARALAPADPENARVEKLIASKAK